MNFKKISPKFVAFLIIVYLSFTFTGCPQPPTEETTEITTKEEKEITLEEVLQEIEKSGEFKIFDRSDWVNITKKTTSEAFEKALKKMPEDLGEKLGEELVDAFEDALEMAGEEAIMNEIITEHPECEKCFRLLKEKRAKIKIEFPEFPEELEVYFDNILKDQYPSILDSILKKDYDFEHWLDTDSVFLYGKGYLEK